MAGPLRAQAAVEAVNAEIDRIVASARQPTIRQPDVGLSPRGTGDQVSPTTGRGGSSKLKVITKPTAIESSGEATQATTAEAPPVSRVPTRRWLRRVLLLVVATAALVVLVLWLPPPLFGSAPIPARVIKVFDGDTVTIATATKPRQTVRLAEIDAPERRQAGGPAARAFLSALVLNRDVEVVVTGYDGYGRAIGHLRVDDADISREMVSGGQAWAYWSYLRDPLVPFLEWRARWRRDGLWAAGSSQPPWAYRAAQKATGTTSGRAPSSQPEGNSESLNARPNSPI